MSKDNSKLTGQDIHTSLTKSWVDLPTELKTILGRPNFACGNIARALRKKVIPVNLKQRRSRPYVFTL